MESKWLQSLRDYMKHVGGWIELDTDYIPKAERVHDGYIMDMILASRQFNDKEIRQLNYCRLFLQAVTLSDITQANGRTLDPLMLKGVLDRYSSNSRWHHVTQEKPLPRYGKYGNGQTDCGATNTENYTNRYKDGSTRYNDNGAHGPSMETTKVGFMSTPLHRATTLQRNTRGSNSTCSKMTPSTFAYHQPSLEKLRRWPQCRPTLLLWMSYSRATLN
jgi:hypothetical protein